MSFAGELRAGTGLRLQGRLEERQGLGGGAHVLGEGLEPGVHEYTVVQGKKGPRGSNPFPAPQ